MRFLNYTYLLILALYVLQVYASRNKVKKDRAAFLFSSNHPFSKIKESPAVKIQKNINYLKVAAFSMILIALARPQVVDVLKEAETFGIDIVLTLDVSESMMAEDLKPKNRLIAAKEVLKEFISNRGMDRLGLVVFAGKSYTQSPLTTDYHILLNILEEVEINYTDQGTAIGLAISESLNRIKDSNAKSKVVILLTDGENNKGSIDPVLAAKLAKSLGVKIYTIGIGSDEGVPVPIGEDKTGRTYAKRYDGSVLITRLNEDTLKSIAAITDGAYFRATSKESLLEIYEKIDELEKSKIEMKKYFSYYELFPYLVFLALLLLFTETIMTTTRYSTFP